MPHPFPFNENSPAFTDSAKGHPPFLLFPLIRPSEAGRRWVVKSQEGGREGWERGGGRREERPAGSPLLSWAVGLSALAAADGDGVKVVEGAQGHPGDGHKLRAEGDKDRLGVVEMLAEVMDDRNYQGVFPAAQTVDPCRREDTNGEGEGRE